MFSEHLLCARLLERQSVDGISGKPLWPQIKVIEAELGVGRVQHSSQKKESLPAVPPRAPGKDGGCPRKGQSRAGDVHVHCKNV